MGIETAMRRGGKMPMSSGGRGSGGGRGGCGPVRLGLAPSQTRPINGEDWERYTGTIAFDRQLPVPLPANYSIMVHQDARGLITPSVVEFCNQIDVWYRLQLQSSNNQVLRPIDEDLMASHCRDWKNQKDQLYSSYVRDLVMYYHVHHDIPPKRDSPASKWFHRRIKRRLCKQESSMQYERLYGFETLLFFLRPEYFDFLPEDQWSEVGCPMAEVTKADMRESVRAALERHAVRRREIFDKKEQMRHAASGQAAVSKEVREQGIATQKKIEAQAHTTRTHVTNQGKTTRDHVSEMVNDPNHGLVKRLSDLIGQSSNGVKTDVEREQRRALEEFLSVLSFMLIGFCLVIMSWVYVVAKREGGQGL